jgi:hypothetical protein
VAIPDTMPDTPRAVPETAGWRTAAVLAAVAYATSIAQPSVLIAVPFLALTGMTGFRGRGTVLAAAVGLVLVASGVRDGIWYAERAWALTAGGVFVGLSFAVPRWCLTSRALTSIFAAFIAFGVFLSLRGDAWGAIDWAVSDRLRAGFAVTLDAMTVLREGRPPPQTLVSAIYRTVEAQATVFPALLAIETMAGLAVAWWLFERLVRGSGSGMGSLATFKFNDHLVWLMVLGLAFLAGLGGDPVVRLGANLAVFMTAMYAVRGLAVGVAVTGGVSLLGYAMIAAGVLLAAPFVLGFAVLLGVADTWLDLRARAASITS